MLWLRSSGAPLLAAAILLAAASAGFAQNVATPSPAPLQAPSDSGPATRQPSALQAAQQNRMRNCNAEAGKRNPAAEARRDFMRDRLTGKTASAPAATGARRG